MAEEHYNPPSLSADPTKKVPRNKPHVKPPLKDVPFTRFMTYLWAGLAAIAAFYIWRTTVWAHDAGGYWNLIVGRRASPAAVNADAPLDADAIARMAAQATAGSAVKGKEGKDGGRKAGGKGAKRGAASIQDQITDLAAALGIAPADLSSAIRPFLDPSVPNPHASAQDPAAAAIAAAQAAKEAIKSEQPQQAEPGLMGVVGEILLD